MAHLTIQQDLCTGCKRCVQDCPMGIPEIGADGKIFSNEANAEVCIYCGHCVAVCPTKAITLNAMTNPDNLAEMADYGIVPFDLSPADCAPTELAQAADGKSMEALIRSRRMTRSFKKELVPHDVINHIIGDVLPYAPAGHNTRGHKALVVEGRDKLDTLTSLSLEYFQQLIDAHALHSFDEKVFKRMILAWKEKKDRVFRTANQAVILHCKSSIVPADPAQKVHMTYFELLANSMGIGTVWAGYFMVAANYPKIKEYLGIPEDETIYAAMMFGYPEFTYDAIPKRPAIELQYK